MSDTSRTTPSRPASASWSTSDPAGPALPALRVELGKRADGTTLLRCTRAEGSVTWQKQQLPNARFFPFHDLTHFAVETTLGLGRGFFGLIADGWEIADTGGKGARGPVPREAVLVEHVVGLFDLEQRSGGAVRLTAAEFYGNLVARADDAGFPLPSPFTDAQLDATRARIAELHAQWRALPSNETLSLDYARPG